MFSTPIELTTNISMFEIGPAYTHPSTPLRVTAILENKNQTFLPL
jgi:hypothetical protein